MSAESVKARLADSPGIVIATTNTYQRAAMAGLKEVGFKRVCAVQNRNSGNRVVLWVWTREMAARKKKSSSRRTA